MTRPMTKISADSFAALCTVIFLIALAIVALGMWGNTS
jgi:hypothetical protein